MKGQNAILATAGLCIGYQVKKKPVAIHTDINLHLHEGEMVCLVGPNGGGKSTLLRTLAGLQDPIAGTVSICGRNIAGMPNYQLAQMRSLVLTTAFESGFLTVRDIVAMGRYPHSNWFGNLSNGDKAIIENAIGQSGLAGYEDRLLAKLSDGERQRAMIAKALAQEPPVILLDEPTAHLDLPNRVAVMKLLQKLAKETKTAVVISTHELDLALQSADSVWLMTKDNAIYTGMPEELALCGTIAKAFNSENVHFDSASGSFIMHKNTAETVALSGEGIAAVWTKRALERLGFLVVQGAGGVSVTQSADGFVWTVGNEGSKAQFCTMESMVSHLQNKNK